MLKVMNASKYYEKTKVFEGISFEVKKNQSLGIAGPSGSGKSTLMYCMQGLESLSEGSLSLSGKPVLMFQDFHLFPHMTVLENLMYAPSLKSKASEHQDLAIELLTKLKIEHKANDYPKSLSGGQKQRVALARCLMVKPQVLLCDEPTSGLDVGTIEEVKDLLKSIKAMGVTMVITSHDLKFLLDISDQVMVLKEGKKILHTQTKSFKGSELRSYLI